MNNLTKAKEIINVYKRTAFKPGSQTTSIALPDYIINGSELQKQDFLQKQRERFSNHLDEVAERHLEFEQKAKAHMEEIKKGCGKELTGDSDPFWHTFCKKDWLLCDDCQETLDLYTEVGL